jgi:NAD-dependent deacetylase
MLAISPTDRVFVLTGAGVSAESGIPTFRGVGGLWRNYRIEEVDSPEAWHRDPRLVWEFYSMRRRVASAAKPNPAHFALAKLEAVLQDRLFVRTQNVDSLHEQAGSRNVVHIFANFAGRSFSTATPANNSYRVQRDQALSINSRSRCESVRG